MPAPVRPVAGAYDQALRRFVRDALGCTCPDSVFDHVATQSDVSFGLSRLRRRIDIGRRLLVYVIQSDDVADTLARLPGLVAQGRADRDRGGFNRLRLVIATAEPDQVTSTAQRLVAMAPERDERLHLHVVSKEAVRDL